MVKITNITPQGACYLKYIIRPYKTLPQSTSIENKWQICKPLEFCISAWKIAICIKIRISLYQPCTLKHLWQDFKPCSITWHTPFKAKVYNNGYKMRLYLSLLPRGGCSLAVHFRSRSADSYSILLFVVQYWQAAPSCTLMSVTIYYI